MMRLKELKTCSIDLVGCGIVCTFGHEFVFVLGEILVAQQNVGFLVALFVLCNVRSIVAVC